MQGNVSEAPSRWYLRPCLKYLVTVAGRSNWESRSWSRINTSCLRSDTYWINAQKIAFHSVTYVKISRQDCWSCRIGVKPWKIEGGEDDSIPQHVWKRNNGMLFAIPAGLYLKETEAFWVLDFPYFGIPTYMPYWDILGIGPKSKHAIHLSFTYSAPYAHSLKVVLYHMF